VEVVKISSKSNPNSCAGALAGVLRSAGTVEVQVVGAGALNQAIKAVAIARGFVSGSGMDLVCVPSFAEIQIDGESRTACPTRPPRPMAERPRRGWTACSSMALRTATATARVGLMERRRCSAPLRRRRTPEVVGGQRPPILNA
jgi:stage V sporulation protein S